MPPHLLTNFEIQRYCQNEPKFNVVYVINLDKYKLVRTCWIALYVNDNSNRSSFDCLSAF